MRPAPSAGGAVELRLPALGVTRFMTRNGINCTPGSPAPAGGPLSDLLLAFDDPEGTVGSELDDRMAPDKGLHLGVNARVPPVLGQVGRDHRPDAVRVAGGGGAGGPPPPPPPPH